MLGHLSQVRELKPSALGCRGRKGRRASDANNVETTFIGSRRFSISSDTYSHLHRIFLAKPDAILIIENFYCFFFALKMITRCVY